MSFKIVLISLISASFIWDLASSANQANDLDEMKANLTELRAEVREIKTLLLRMSEKFDQKAKSSEGVGVGGMTSRCTSLCESKVKTLVNDTSNRFQKHLDFCLNNSSRKALNACDPDPCVNGGSCESLANGTDFRCNDCPVIWSGDKCQNFSCVQDYQGKCFRREDTVYYSFDMYEPWERTKERCARNGMSMVLAKDRNTSEYLAQELRTVYESYGHHFSGVWLGLRSENSDRKFGWVDGSELGPYTGGLDLNKAPSDHACVYFQFHDPGQLWDVSKCELHLFPFCEKRISSEQ